MAFDKSDKLDVTSMLHPNQARKWLAEVLRVGGLNRVRLTKHCREEMQNDSLASSDIYNVLMGGHIYDYPEFEHGTYRYRVETQKIAVIITFEVPDKIRCITTWRKL